MPARTASPNPAGRRLSPAEDGGNYGAQYRRDWSRESHVTRRQGTIKDRQGEAACRACGQCPFQSVRGRDGVMMEPGECPHQNHAAEVGDQGDQEGVGALGCVAADEIADAPGEDGGQAKA
jgi:hypothetical protein